MNTEQIAELFFVKAAGMPVSQQKELLAHII